MNDIWLCVVTLHMQWQRYVTVLYVIYCGLTETLICRQFQTRTRSETAVSGKMVYLKVPLLYNVGFLSLEIFIVALLSDYFFICIFYEAGSRNPLQNSNLTNQVPHREPVTQNKVCLSLVFHPNCAWMPFSAFPFTLCVLCHRCLWTVPPNHLRVNSSTCEWNTELSFWGSCFWCQQSALVPTQHVTAMRWKRRRLKDRNREKKSLSHRLTVFLEAN